MANLDDLRDEATRLQEDLLAISSAVTSLSFDIQKDLTDALRSGVGEARALNREFTSSTNRVQTLIKQQIDLVEKSKAGVNVEKELLVNKQKLNTALQAQAKAVSDIQKETKVQGFVNQQNLTLVTQEADEAKTYNELAKQKNAEIQKAIPIEQKIGTILKDNIDKFDKTGTLSKIINFELFKSLSLLDLAKAAIAFFVQGMFTASAQAASFRKELGISSEASYELRRNMVGTSLATENSFINVERLSKGFVELSKQTGLVADFGGRTLETFTVLNQQMGLGAKEASQLTLYARLQSKDTEGVLSATTKTIGTLIKQKGIAFDTGQIFRDMASASAATAVSLGKNPQLLAEAAVSARALGLSLNQVENVASKLLDFEQSISAELEAELISGKQINLEKARLAALNNDLTTLSEELMNNEAAIEAFATNNRLAQESIATALGLSREELAQMTLQQEFNNLSAEQFKDTYGEVTYKQLQSRSAQERLADALSKMVEIGANLAATFAPMLDVIAAIVSNGPAVIGIFTALATRSLIHAIASITASSAMLGPLGIGLAAGGIAALMASVAQSKQAVQDGIADSSRGPFTITDAYGKMAVTAKGDNLVATPNVNANSSQVDMSETNRLLAGLLNKNTNFSIGPQHLGTGMNLYTYTV